MPRQRPNEAELGALVVSAFLLLLAAFNLHF